MSEKTMAKSYWSQTIKAALFSLIICTFLVLIFALVIKLFSIPANVLPIVNQVIKCVAVAVGCFLTIKRDRGFIKGLMGGLLYVLLCNLVFLLLGGSFSWTQVGIDFIICVLVGALCGAISSAKSS